MRATITGVVLALSTSMAPAESYKGYEMPPFGVVSTVQGYELRDYAPHLLASVKAEGTATQSASAGFRKLAAYIFGGNAEGEKIAMTVPVGQVQKGDGFEITFMMPAKFDLETLPRPKSGDIRFRWTSPERHAVLRFSGYASGATLNRRAAELRDLLKRDGLVILDGPRFAYYDDPFTLPWRRRNEVAFVVAK